jgi:hypothetical protein
VSKLFEGSTGAVYEGKGIVMQLTPAGQIIKGYKATDENMCCLGFQFELGKWYTHDGEISICKSGFHFCEYPSGPWVYYNNGRIFRIEAEEVLLSTEPGADRKHVARKIRLVEEINIDGNKNTGNWNTGNRNTGDRNTGDWNAGNINTGNINTGNRNTGNWNTGDWNTGDSNTGNGNCGDYHSGCLNYGEAPFYIFNKRADRSKIDFSLVNRLSELLCEDKDIDPGPFYTLPNFTPEALKKLHEAHKKARKKGGSHAGPYLPGGSS